MSTEKPESLTENEVATAIRLTVFPNDPSNPDGPHSTLSSLSLHTADEIAHALFQTALARREGDRWVAGALYVSYPPGSISPWVYQRGSGGWFAVNDGQRYDDGALDTSGFQRLTTSTAGDGPLKQPEHDVRGTAYSHARGWYRDCPACKAAAESTADQTCPGGHL